jgi:hypothetical protein
MLRPSTSLISNGVLVTIRRGIKTGLAVGSGVGVDAGGVVGRVDSVSRLAISDRQ